MTDVNNVELVGRVKGKTFSFEGKNGKTPVFKFHIETVVEFVNQEGKLSTKPCTVSITAFGDVADTLKPKGEGDGIDEGTTLKVCGYITNNSYVSKKTNEKVFETVVIARTIDIIGDKEPWTAGPPVWGEKEQIPF
jgi:hypothetical protein